VLGLPPQALEKLVAMPPDAVQALLASPGVDIDTLSALAACLSVLPAGLVQR
jgi:hypothetical protein